MDPNIFYTILSIIGFFCVVGLTINGYFIKQMLDSLNQVKIQTAVLIEKSQSKEARLSKVERENEVVRRRLHEFGNILNHMNLKNIVDEE